jgi:acyl carrier protein
MISKEEFRNAVIEAIKRVKDIDHVEIANDEDFSLVGLDSLDSMDLVLQVEALTGLNFGEFDASEARNIDAFYTKARQILGNSD